MLMINIRLIFVALFVTEYLETAAGYSLLEWTYAKKYAFVGTNSTNEIIARKANTAIFCASFCSKIMSCTGFMFSKDFRTCRFLSKFLTAANNSQLTKQKWIYFERNSILKPQKFPDPKLQGMEKVPSDMRQQGHGIPFPMISEIPHHLIYSRTTYLPEEEVDCPDVWKENQRSMYCFVHQKVNWTSSQQKCSSMGAYLVAIESEQEDAWINQQILLYREKGNFGDWWTGATDEKSEGKFYWHHSKELLDDVFDQWNSDEPSGGLDENCVLKKYRGNWQDFPCSLEYYYICER